MSWRSAPHMTGTNDVPLGKQRRFGPQATEDSDSSYSRGSDDHRGRQDMLPPPPPSNGASDSNGTKKRRSRWGEAKVETPGLPTAVSSQGLSIADLDKYAVQVRLDEINRKLRMNDFIPPENERSPSPPPTYDSHGRRTNTREVRYRKKLEEERVKLIDRAIKTDPNYRPPAEYHQQKRSHRPQDKVYIPVKEFPEINFFGLLVGPRGNSLKKMERESGAKISIRGKGSVKEGKGRPDAYADDSEEDLHCLVMADTEEKVAACVALINRVIETAASTPEGENDHKRNQLRELAALNGTLRDDENQICQNCGNVGHRKYDCPEQRNFTANIICRVCGSAGHMARDCTQRRDPNGFHSGPPGGGFAPPPSSSSGGGGPGGKFDSEYASLMAELGESAGGAGPTSGDWNRDGAKGGSGADSSGGYIPPGFTTVPPWRRPDVWASSSHNLNQQGGYNNRSQGGYSGGYNQGGGYGGYQQQQQQPQQQQQQQYGNYYQGGQQGYGNQGAGDQGYAQYYSNLYQQSQYAQ